MFSCTRTRPTLCAPHSCARAAAAVAAAPNVRLRLFSYCCVRLLELSPPARAPNRSATAGANSALGLPSSRRGNAPRSRPRARRGPRARRHRGPRRRRGNGGYSRVRCGVLVARAPLRAARRVLFEHRLHSRRCEHARVAPTRKQLQNLDGKWVSES